jgi:hypothetical protein
MLSNAEQRALNSIEVRLSRSDPALAAALSFAAEPVRPPWTARRARHTVRVLLGLFTVLTLATSWIWASAPNGPCGVGSGMTNRQAIAAAADMSRPMPDNVGCVIPTDGSPG